MTRKSIRHTGITMVLFLTNLCLVAIHPNALVHPRAQGTKKTISGWRTILVYPVEIADFKVEGNPVKQDEEFEAGAHWLKSLTFKLKNKSDKTIIYVAVDLDFPQTAAAVNGSTAQHQITLGQDPENKLRRRPLHFPRAESMEIELATEYDQIETLFKGRLPIDSVTRVVVRLHSVMFDDGTLWSAGMLYRRDPDPNDPIKWIKVDN